MFAIMAAENSFLLSSKTEAVWLSKGGLQLRRVKDEEEDFDAGYKIYVPYPSLKSIISKKEAIQESAQQVSDSEVEGPLNITLHKRQVMRLSLFYEELYYGIHQMEEDGRRVRIGLGMNLSEPEFLVLVKKLEHRFKSQSGGADVDVGADVDGEDEAGPSAPKKTRKRTIAKVGAHKKEMDKPSFQATMYGWCWYNQIGAQYVPNPENAERWHFSAKDCFFDATTNRPIAEEADCFKLEVFDKKQTIPIDVQLWDAAFARLIRYNSSMCAQEDKINGLYTTEQDDLDIYGKLAFDRIPLNEIYDLCRKTIGHYGQLSKDMEMFVMKMGVTYDKAENFLSRMRDGDLNPLLAELMDYTHLLD
jgi:hypothetical protein